MWIGRRHEEISGDRLYGCRKSQRKGKKRKGSPPSHQWKRKSINPKRIMYGKNKDKIQKRGRKEEQTEGKHLCFMGVSACSSVKFGSYRGGAAGGSEEDFVGWGIGRPMKTDRAVLSAELREAAALPPWTVAAKTRTCHCQGESSDGGWFSSVNM